MSLEQHTSAHPCKRLFATKIIQDIVAKHYKIKRADLLSDARSVRIARPRQLSMYLCKVVLDKPLVQIGFRHGNRDATAVQQAVRNVERFMEMDQAFAQKVDQLRQACVAELAS